MECDRRIELWKSPWFDWIPSDGGITIGKTQFRELYAARWITTARVVLAAVGATQAMAEFVPAVGCAADKQPGDKQVGQLVGPEKKVFQTDDGKTVHATYFKSPGDRESPVVVLLHMKDGNRFVWQGGEEDSFARKLQKEEFAVITVDLRYHGESKVGGGSV
jgi:hypothetical protein